MEILNRQEVELMIFENHLLFLPEKKFPSVLWWENERKIEEKTTGSRLGVTSRSYFL